MSKHLMELTEVDVVSDYTYNKACAMVARYRAKGLDPEKYIPANYAVSQAAPGILWNDILFKGGRPYTPKHRVEGVWVGGNVPTEFRSEYDTRPVVYEEKWFFVPKDSYVYNLLGLEDMRGYDLGNGMSVE